MLRCLKLEGTGKDVGSSNRMEEDERGAVTLIDLKEAATRWKKFKLP